MLELVYCDKANSPIVDLNFEDVLLYWGSGGERRKGGLKTFLTVL